MTLGWSSTLDPSKRTLRSLCGTLLRFVQVEDGSGVLAAAVVEPAAVARGIDASPELLGERFVGDLLGSYTTSMSSWLDLAVFHSQSLRRYTTWRTRLRRCRWTQPTKSVEGTGRCRLAVRTCIREVKQYAIHAADG